MTTTDVENLSYTDLKKRRDELVAAVKDQPPEELARRYVQARTDAKGRDEKMAEQGKTITELQLSLESLREQGRAATAKLTSEASADRKRLKAEALRNHAAITAAAKLLNDAAAAMLIEAADKTGG